MAGPYAHITLLHGLINALHASPCRLPSQEVASAVQDHFPFCALGSVSPDFPNLAPGDGGDVQWADAMHYSRSGEMITCGVRLVAQAPPDARPRLLAWLLGYCSHLVTDATIHPVVRIRVGDYGENRRQHRICEMNQDVHIFARMNRGELVDSDRFSRDIVACSASPGCLDRDVAALWERLLQEVHPQLYDRNPPRIQEWFGTFCTMAAGQPGKRKRLFPLASLIAEGVGRGYPLKKHLDHQFILELATPWGVSMHYDDIFDRAAEQVAEMWNLVGREISGAEQHSPACFGNWDLDTGLDEDNRLVFWG